MNAQALLKAAKQQLVGLYDVQEAQAMAFLLLEHFCQISKIAILQGTAKEVLHSQAKKIEAAVEQLLQGTPIQHITGKVEFCNCRLQVNSDVLIPRGETEELVAWVLDDLAANSQLIQNRRIIDIGTGSGCIAIALAKALPAAQVEAVDVSRKALHVAQQNAVLNHVNVNFWQGDVLQMGAPSTPLYWDAIVSNPPYVCDSEKCTLPRNVLHEPALALFVPDNNPLLFYEHIAQYALQTLSPQGNLYFEINERWGNKTVQLLQAKGFGTVVLRQDLNGKDRMVRAQKNLSSIRQLSEL